jgi:hypothetical protein
MAWERGKGANTLIGERVVLRPVRERDLGAFITAHTEISNRGEFFPLGVQPESVLRRNFAETGFWERDEGTLLIWNRDDVMVGHIEFFRPVNYWDAYELSYQLYGAESTPARATRPRRCACWSTTCSRRRRSTASPW